MAKAARRYDIYVPLTYNDGRPIPEGQLDEVEQRLLTQFGGVTSQHRDFPLRGIWQGETQLYFDQIILMTVLDFRRRGSTRFIAELKTYLLHLFRQLQILITEPSLRVH